MAPWASRRCASASASRDAQAETELAIEALARTYVAPAAVVTTTPVTIRTVDGGIIRDKRFAAEHYDFGNNPPLPAEVAVPYSGFRTYAALNGQTATDEALVFQGASLFRALAKGQVFGVMARRKYGSASANLPRRYSSSPSALLQRASSGSRRSASS